MLRCLTVENYALIDRLQLELDARLNIITGETRCGQINSARSAPDCYSAPRTTERH